MDMEDNAAANIDKITARALADIPHGFLGRGGGLSGGIYAGLNVGIGSDDDKETVARNRHLAAQAILPGADLSSVYQIHSNQVVVVTETLTAENRPQADAMVTDRIGILLGILTADCVPVLLADKDAGIVGAAHAGWKGAITGVTDSAISAMESLGADRGKICAAIGPCIAQKSYEVDDGFFQNFINDNIDNERFFSDGAMKSGCQHYQFDIEGYVTARLAAAGIQTVECAGQDTYSQPDVFYSYRRSCHRGESDYGRQISLIGLPE